MDIGIRISKFLDLDFPTYKFMEILDIQNPKIYILYFFFSNFIFLFKNEIDT